MFKNFVRCFILTTSSALLACGGEGRLANSSGQGNFISITERSVIDYDSSFASVVFSGQLSGNSVDDRITFFVDPQCQSSIAEVTTTDFINNGGVTLNFSVASQESSVYYSTLSEPECNFLENYTLPALVPSIPTFDRVVPASPNRISTTPGLFGKAFPPSARVRIFSDSNCQNLLNEGTQNEFSQSGIGVSVIADLVTPIYAHAIDSLNQTSSCNFLVNYEHSNSLSDPPIFNSFVPNSPNNQILNPLIVGQIPVNSDTISLYTDSGCSNLLASGNSGAFTSPGLQFDAISNDSIELFAQSFNTDGVPSACTRMSEYIHDSIAPPDPVYSSILPLSPNNFSTTPSLTGTLAGDATSISFYREVTCTNRIGIGSKSDFESTGIVANVLMDNTTTIYGKAFDLAGNGSSCVEFTTYTHNTIAPNPPTFQNFNPASPNNQTVTPFIGGSVAERTVQVRVYDSDTCTNLIGSGSANEFTSSMIQMTAQTETTTDVFITALDVEGNESSCTSAAAYSHSTAPSTAPQFSQTIPPSPSNSSLTPVILGTADSSVVSINIYDDNSCANLIQSGSRNAFLATGIQINVLDNHNTSLYAKAVNDFGNESNCVHLTDYLHVDEVPLNPTFSAITPLSPNNITREPVISGQSLQNMASLLPPNLVSFYTDFSCIVKVGEGTPADFQTGIQVTLPPDRESPIFARAFDAANNRSDCTPLTNYTHNSLEPAVPIFENSVAASPSYSSDINIFGRYGSSPDFMNRTDLSVFSDSSCNNLIQSGNPQLFESTGFSMLVPENNLTELYARTTNEVGTNSACSLLTNFRHSDIPPSGLQLNPRADGSVSISWFPDNIASPIPTYTLERSINPTGPFAIIDTGLLSVTYIDRNVSEGETYYYRVYASNNTGRSEYSTPVSITISAPPTNSINSLSAQARNSSVSLSWLISLQNSFYKVYRSEQIDGPFDQVYATTNQSAYIDDDVVNDTTYYYMVRATNPSEESVESNIVSVTPKDSPTAIDNFILTPVNDTRICGGSASVLAVWNAKDYFSSYTLNSSSSKGQVQNSLASTGQNFVTVCNINSRISNTGYLNALSQWPNGALVASNSNGFYSTSNSTLSAFSGDGEIVLSWSSASPPNELAGFDLEYDLFYSPDPDLVFQPLVTGTLSRSFVHSVPNQEGRYYYVQAYITDGDGDKVYIGAPSAIANASTDIAPGAPQNLLVNNYESDKIRLNWSAPGHYNGFSIYQADSFAGPYTEVAYTENEFYEFTNLTNGLKYFKVRTVWGSLESSDSNTVEQRVATIENLTASSTPSQIDLSWDTVSAANDYVIYKDTDPNGSFSTSFVSLTANFTDTAVVTNTAYFYKVKARFVDTTEGALASVKSVLQGANIPTGLNASMTISGGIKLNWQPIDGPALYRVYSASSISGPFTLQRATSVSTATLFGFTPLTEVFFKVEYEFNMQTFSSSVIAFTPTPNVNTPTVTTGDNQISLSWTPVLGAVDYNILRSTDSINFTPLVNNYASTSYLDMSAVNSSLYFYKIEANFTGGLSSISQMSLGRTPGVVPPAPSGLQAENNGTGTEAEVSWAQVDGVNRYAVYVSTTSGSYGAPSLITSSNLRVSLVGLTQGQKYYFSVSSMNGEIQSPLSSEISLVVSGSLQAPEVGYNSPMSVAVSWPVAPGANSYDLYRSIDSYNYEVIATGLSGTAYTDSSLSVLETNFYKYKALDASGTEISFSDVSEPVNLNTTPLAPTNLSAFINSTSSVNLSWTKQPSVSSYQVLRSNTQGTGYVVIADLASTESNYVDNSLSANQNYYYVVTSSTSIGKPSLYSNEVSVSTEAGISDLALIDQNGAVGLSWSALPGVSQYGIYRATKSGGPYAFLSNTNSLNYEDDTISPNSDYFYIVHGLKNLGEKTVASNEETISPIGFLDFEVTLDLIDSAISSEAGLDINFLRGQISFEPDDYDGITDVSFEVMAQNFDGQDRSVFLLDESDAIIDTILIPAMTSQFTRLRTSGISLNPNLDSYKIALEGTSSASDLVVKSAKLIILQTDATKTKIFYPLLSTESAPSSSDYSQPIFSTFSNSLMKGDSFITYLRETNMLSELTNFNSWELEAVVASSLDAEGKVSLFNEDEQSEILGSQIVIEENTPTLGRAFLTEGIENLSIENEGQEYSLRLSCEVDCNPGDVRLYKAGLWIRLHNLKSLRLFHKLNSRHTNLSSDLTIEDERINIVDTNYSSPSFKFRGIASDGPVDSSDFELRRVNAASGSSSAISVLNTILMVDSDMTELYTSPPYLPVSGWDYITHFISDTGSVNLESSFIMIDVSR